MTKPQMQMRVTETSEDNFVLEVVDVSFGGNIQHTIHATDKTLGAAIGECADIIAHHFNAVFH